MRNLQTPHIVVGVVLAASLAVTYTLWHQTQQHFRHEVTTEFDSHANKIIAQLEQHLAAYKQALYGVRALFVSEQTISRDAFNQYVSSLQLNKHYPGIQGVSYSPIIQNAEKASHINQIRQQGFPEYTIHPPGERELYTPVLYLQPLTERNARALGYDTYSEAIRRSAQHQARDSGNATMSGKLKLVQETETQPQAGFLIFLPVYRHGAPLDSIEDRRANIAGFVAAVFRMGDLMAGLGDMHSTELDLEIYDGDISINTLMYDSDDIPLNPAEDSELEHTRPINIAGRNWTLLIHSSPEFKAHVDKNKPAFVATSGVLLSILLALLVNAYLRSTKTARELKLSEERWRYALEGAGDGVWDWNIQTNHVTMSRKWKAILGYADNELENNYEEWEQRVHPEDLQNTLDVIQAHINGNTPTFINEHRLLHKDGSWRWVLGRGMVVSHSNDGKPLRMIGTITDITSRKQADADLQEQRDYNNAVLEAAGNIIVVLDLSGNFVQFNRAAEELTGFHRDQLLGQPVWNWVIPEEQVAGVKNVFENLKQGNLEVASQYENDWLTHDGSRRTIDWHNTVLRDEDGNITHIVALGYDITERNRTEDALKKLNATLESRVYERTLEFELARNQADAANRAKSNFLSNMSHEIRSPLAAIIGFSESLVTDDFDERERNKIISTIARNGRHLQQVVNDILDLSKIEANQLEVEEIETSIFLLMGETDSLLGMIARDKGLEFKITYHFPLPECIVTDPTYLKQILVNLCSNAIKFTDEGRIEIEVSSTGDFNQIQFVVSDSGIGMTADESKHVFEPFIQADSTTTRKYGGTGLGLSISSKLAKALDGNLTCDSRKGYGSRFTLTITNHDEVDSTIINSLEEVGVYYDEQRYQVEIKSLTGSILLVEDSPDNQQLVSMYIRKTGADLTIAENGKQALKKALEREYDLILMDMQMPVMDGIEAITRLRAAGYTRPIVSLTANAMLSDREKCMAAGANDYLAKPIELYQFYHVLNRYLPEDVTKPVSKKTHDFRKTIQDNPQYQAIVERFIKHLPQMYEDISNALANEDWDKLQDKSHDLKGMGGAMGYPDITEKAGLLNNLIKQKKHDELAGANAALKKLCHSIVQEFDKNKNH